MTPLSSSLQKSVTSFKGNLFPVVRKGYDRAKVEQYVWAIDALVKGGDSIDVDELRNKLFPVARRGYSRPEVHRYLGDLAEQIDPTEDYGSTPLAA